MNARPWSTHCGEGPLVAVALHDGHEVRPELEELLAISPEERLREEDPFTGCWTRVAPIRIVVHRSRFEVDLNRPPERAVYSGPEDAWGLDVWRTPLPAELRLRSLAIHERFYCELDQVLDDLVDQQGGFVLLDLHSYNHRRGGPDAPPAPQAENPDINVGTGTLDRSLWGDLVDRFQADLRRHTVAGRPLDVRENIRFRGGYLSRHIHERYHGVGCALAVEVKKVFMDEWSGQPSQPAIEEVGAALEGTIDGLRTAFRTAREKRERHGIEPRSTA